MNLFEIGLRTFFLHELIVSFDRRHVRVVKLSRLLLLLKLRLLNRVVHSILSNALRLIPLGDSRVVGVRKFQTCHVVVAHARKCHCLGFDCRVDFGGNFRRDFNLRRLKLRRLSLRLLKSLLKFGQLSLETVGLVNFFFEAGVRN